MGRLVETTSAQLMCKARIVRTRRRLGPGGAARGSRSGQNLKPEGRVLRCYYSYVWIGHRERLPPTELATSILLLRKDQCIKSGYARPGAALAAVRL